MKTGKRILALLTALALLVSVVPATVFAAEPDGGVTEISLWTYPIGGWGDEAATAELIARFEEEHPDIHVDVTILDYATGDDKVNVAIANGTTPDLIMEGPERVVQEWGGHMLDLSDMLDKGDLAEINANVLATCYGENGLCMYPYSGVVHTMAINKTVFESAGAMQYLDEVTRTWNSTEDFFRAVQAVYEYTERRVGVVFSNGMGGDQATRALVTNLYGGRYTNEDHTAYTWTDSENIAALQALRECDGIEFAPDMNGGMEIEAFRSGDLTMAFCWNVAQHTQASGKTDGGDEILVMAFPSDGEPALQGGIWGFGAFENYDEDCAAAAKEFIRWICDSEATADAVRMSGNNPIRSNVQNVWEYDPINREFESLMPLMGDYYQISNNWQNARVFWYQMLTDIAQGNDIESTVAYWTAMANGDTDERVTLEVLVPIYGDNTCEWWGRFEAAFEIAHENVDLVIDCVSWNDIYGIVEARLDEGDVPDILNLDEYEQFVDDLLPIADVMYPETYDKIYPNFLEESRMGDTIWAAPDLASARGLYYNVDIFEELGLSVPTTWTELLDVCEAIKGYYGNEGFAWGMDISENEAFAAFAMYIWSNDGGFLDADGNWALNTEENAQALEFAADLHSRGYTTPADLNRYEIQDLFLEGKVAMMLAPDGLTGNMVGVNYAVADMPANDGRTASTVGVMDRIMCFNNGYSEAEMEAIREFFAYFYDDERYSEWVMDEGFLPATRTAMELIAADDPSMEIWCQLLPDCQFYPVRMPGWWDVRDVLDDFMFMITEGGEDVRMLLDELQEVANIGGSGGDDYDDTDPFLSFRWLADWGEGWFQEDYWMEDGSDWSNGYTYGQSMIPGDEVWQVYYLNVWNEETQRFDATPVHVEFNEYLDGQLLCEMEDVTIMPGAEDGEYYYRVRALDNGWDQIGYISYTMDDGTVVSLEVEMRRGESGFYGDESVSNESYLRQVRYNRITGEGTTIYFTFESEYWTLDRVEPVLGYIDIPDLDVSDIYTLERLSDTLYKITLDPWVVSAGAGFELALVIYATDPDGNPNDWEWWQSIWCEPDYSAEHFDATLYFNGTDYNAVQTGGETVFFRYADSGMDNIYGDDIWVMEETPLPEGVSYDLNTNTITLNNAHLENMSLNYGWYDENEDSWYTELPTPNVTIELIGENIIESTWEQGLGLREHLHTTITGDGSLYVRMENSMQRDEWGNCQNFDAIHLNNESTLTIAGNATVTAEIAGQAWETCWDGDMILGRRPAMSAAIRGNQGSLTLKDNATLTTVVPEGARTNGEWIENEDDAIWGDRTPGGYYGINGMLHITVEGGTLNTQELETDVLWGEEGVDEIGSYTQTGGTVNINPIGSKQKIEQWMWDEELQEEVYLGEIDHYHYNGLGNWEGCDISISGGELNVTAVPTEEELASSAHVSAIFTDNGGGVEISGGTVNVNVGAGDAITTKNLTVTGGVLNAVNENGTALRVLDSFTVTGGTVDLFGRDGDTVDLRDSDTTISGGTVTITGENNQVVGLGSWEWEYYEREGSLTVSGGKLIINNSETDRNTLEVRQTGKVRFCGDAQVEFNGGILAVNGEMTVEDNAYVDINDGRIDINNGGSLTMDGGQIDLDTAWDLDHEDQWPCAVYVGRDCCLTVNDGKFTVDAENYNKGIQCEGEFTLNGGEVTVKLDGDKIGYHEDESVYGTDFYPGFAMSSWGRTTINGGVLNLDALIGYELYFDAGHNGHPENYNVGLIVNGGTMNVTSQLTGMELYAPAQINGGQVNVNATGDYYPPTGRTRAYGIAVADNECGDPNVPAYLEINGGEVNVVVDGIDRQVSNGIMVSYGDLYINGGKIRVDAGFALWGESDDPTIHIREDMNIICLETCSNVELLGSEKVFEYEDENGETVYYHYYINSVEHDDEPGEIYSGEGLDKCHSLLITSNSCGEATWTIEDGVLNISGNGEMADYGSVADRPWNALSETITAVTVGSEVTYVGTYAFAGMECLSNVSFLGDAPSIADNAFEGIAATAFYPENNNTWKKSVMKSYGGQLTWKPMGKPAVEITTQPADFVGIVGDMASFTVEADREDVTYQWFFSSDNGATWQKSSCTTKTLTVEFKAYRLGYLYRCEVTDSEGNTVVSDAAVLAALELDLLIVTQPESYVGAVNDEVTFTVEATGNGLTYEWFFSTDGGETWEKSYSPGYMTNTLAPILRSHRDGNMYKCVVTDVLGNRVESQAVSMTVEASDVIIVKQPVSVENAVLSQLYGYSVVAEGVNLTYRWELSSDGGETWEESWNDGYNTPNLSVRMNANRDGNLYRCAVTSGQKLTVYTDAVILDMQDPSVELISQSGNVFVTSNKTATFTVEAEGMDLTYLWYRSNDQGATWYQTYLDGYNTNTLSFMGVAGRAAMYMCKITDGSGKAVWSSPVKLQILSAELQILTQPEDVTCANGEKAVFTVEAQGDGLKYQWQSSTDGVEWTPSYLDGYNTNTFYFAVIGNRATKMYRCVITDVAGNSVVTDVVSVTIA